MMLAAERRTERKARTVACPQCGARPGQWCRVLDSWGQPHRKRVTEYSHTGRLDKARARR